MAGIGRGLHNLVVLATLPTFPAARKFTSAYETVPRAQAMSRFCERKVPLRESSPPKTPTCVDLRRTRGACSPSCHNGGGERPPVACLQLRGVRRSGPFFFRACGVWRDNAEVSYTVNHSTCTTLPGTIGRK
ncbi:hypothetical protein Bbelb_059570 [Branchiostoma belcheri]|nr:hypothetical protein Bbelb_059570 [Branchiostoma belcheri]